MANTPWVNPKKMTARQQMDRRLERFGLLNYQTQGLSPQEIAERYARANITINSKSQWFKDNYGFDAPDFVTDRQKMAQYRANPQAYLPNVFPTLQPKITPAGGNADRPVNFLNTGQTLTPTVPLAPTLTNANSPFASLAFGTPDQARKGEINWTDLSTADRKKLLTDPNFYKSGQITQYQPWMQQQILADPNFDWKQLPDWQRAYYSASSNPATMGAIQGGTLGAAFGLPGVVVGGIVGGTLGYAAGVSGYDPTKEAWEQGDKKFTFDKNQLKEAIRGTFGYLNWAAEQAEKIIGTGAQVANAAADPTRAVVDVLNRETWDASANFFEVITPAYIDAMNKGKGELGWDDLLKVAPPVYMMAKLGDIVLNPEKYKGQEIYLGAANPIPLDESWIERIDNARAEIQAGRPYREVMMDMQTGIMAQIGDMAGQAIADPLNVVGRVTAKTGEVTARVTGDKVAESAFAGASGYFDAQARLRNTINTPGAAQIIDPNFRVDEMGWITKRMAGLTSTGQVTAGPFSKTGLLDYSTPKKNLRGFMEYITNHNPESRARIGQDLLVRNIGNIMAAWFGGQDVDGFYKWWNSFSNGDMTQAAELSNMMSQSPEFYTVLPAAKGFDIDGSYAKWEATEQPRQAITRIAEMLGENPQTLIDDLVKRGTAEQDFMRLQERLAKLNSPEAKALLAEMQEGRFTADMLSSAVKLFSGGDVPFHPSQWMAQTLDDIKAHYDKWAIDNFKLDEESKKTLFRVSAVLKSAQSILLLGANPGYFISNVLPTMATRAFDGVWGYMTPSAIDRFMSRMGFDIEQGLTPSRFDEVVGVSDIRKQDAIRTAVQGKGVLTNISRTLGKIGQAMPFTALSRLLEGYEGKQAYTIGIMKFWGEAWRRGKGFRELPRSVIEELTRVAGPRATEILYASIEAGMNKNDIVNIVSTANRNVQSRALIHEAAQNMNVPTSKAASILEQAGVLDALDVALKGAKNEAKIDRAFDRARQIARSYIDQQAARDAIANIEHIANRLTTEGVKSITDVLIDTVDADIENWMHGLERMGEAADAMDSIEDPVTRSNLWALKYAENAADRQRNNAHKASVYIGVLKALGQDTTTSGRALLANMAATDAVIDNAYSLTIKLRDDFFTKWNDDWDNPQRQTERNSVEKQIDKVWKDATKTEIKNTADFGELLGQQYDTSFGIEAGEAARQAWEDITAFRREMTQRRDDFRRVQNDAREQGVPLRERQLAAKEFWGETYKYMIVEMQRIKTDAIHKLDNIANGRSGGEVIAPTDPTTPPTNDPGPAPAVDNTAALREAAQARQGLEAASLDALWTLAEEYGFDRSIANDAWGLTGALAKLEYGGDPTFKGTVKDAATRFTLDEVDAILEKRRQIKDTENENRIAARNMELQRKKEQAAKKAKKPTNILTRIIDLGGIDWKYVKEITGEKNPNISQKRIFSKTGRNRWGLDEMARLLAEDGYPINLDDPNDTGGVGQTVDLIQRAFRGEYIYSLNDADTVMRQAENDIANAELEYIESTMIEDAFDENNWMTDVTLAQLDGDISRMDELFSTLPDEYLDRAATSTETYREYIENRRQEAADSQQDQAIAEVRARSELAIEHQQRAADIAMTRDDLAQRYKEVFPNASAEQIDSWMVINDAVVKTIAKIAGVEPEAIYARFYRDIIKGTETGSAALFQQAGAGDIKGGVNFVDGQAIISAWDGADISTIVHENGHVFRRMMQDVAAKGDGYFQRDLFELDIWVTSEAARINNKISNGAALTAYEMAVSDGKIIPEIQNGQWQVGHEEIFARSWEKYIADGQVPSASLMTVFQNFTKWLTEIYKTIVGSDIDIDIPDDVRKVFDRLVGVENLRVDMGKVLSNLGYDPSKYYIDQNGAILKRRTLEIKVDKDLARMQVDNIINNLPAKGKRKSKVTDVIDESFADKVRAAKERDALKEGKIAEENDINKRVRELSQWTIETMKNPTIGDFVKYEGRILEVGFVTPGGLLRLQDPETKQRVDQVHPSAVTKADKPADISVGDPVQWEKTVTGQTETGVVTGFIGENYDIQKDTGGSVSYPPKKVEKQSTMFSAGEDLPFFSQTPMRAEMEAFTPTEQVKNETMFDMRPQFGTGEASLAPMVPNDKPVWQMTKSEFNYKENLPKYEAIRDALVRGKKIILATHTKAWQLTVDTIKLTPSGEVRHRIGGGKWNFLLDDQINSLAKQAGYSVPDIEDRVYHVIEVKNAIERGETVPPEVLADYPYLVREAPTFIVDNDTNDVGLVIHSDGGQPHARFAGPLTIAPSNWRPANSSDFDLAMKNAGAERKARLNGWKKAAENISDLTPELADRYAESLADITNEPIKRQEVQTGREKLLLESIVNRLKNKDWFAKSRDFEAFIRSLGFNIENEAELNLAYDIMEGAYNIQAREIRARLDESNAPLLERLTAMDDLEQNLTEARRTLGKMKLQQFSTPLTLSEAAGWSADVQRGDVVGEPTAGTANLVDLFSQRDGVKVVVNELDPGRKIVLELIGYDPTAIDLMSKDWVIENGKKAGTWANVMISNPPWGAYSTGKYGKPVNTPVKMNDWSQRFTYLEMMRLAEGGRFVGVMPTNWLYTMDRATRAITNKPSEFYKWLKKNYTVQAVIESPPGAYKNRATDISSLLVVIDKRMSLLETPTIEKYGDSQPKSWAEYAEIVQQVPKRSMEAAYNGQEKLSPRVAGPDASGIVDPAAVRGVTSKLEDIGKPVETPDKRTVESRRITGNEQRTDRPAEPGIEQPIAEPTNATGTGVEDTPAILVDEQPAGIPETIEQPAYSDAFLARIEQGREAVKNSGSFTEYVGRAPLQPGDVTHPHPNTVVETKGLAGVPFPELEEAYRPSPSVMRAMNNRALSYEGNIDPAWAAIQQNDKHGMGMLIADDVGMGKSRTAAAFVLDRIEKGKKRILVVTKDGQNVLNLMNGEFPQVYKGVADENGAFITQPGADYPAKRIFLSGENFPEVKKGEAAIPTFDEPTVYFVTSSEFVNFEPKLKALDLEVLVVDEAHLFKNVGSTARGQAWVDLHQHLLARNANFLYLTATPGVDLADLRYLFGLRVWGMDGFEDWVKIITGQESIENVKQKAKARENIDAWVEKVQAARKEINAEYAEINRDGNTYEGLKVGRVELYQSTEYYNKGTYSFIVDGKYLTSRIKNEIEAVIIADAVSNRLNEFPMERTAMDIREMMNDAENAFIDKFNPPGREEIRAVEMKDASDILQKAEKGKWGKKGLGAFDSTLPPAHTEQIMRELKVAGSYMARDISRAGVDFGVKEYTPPPADKAQFNRRVMLYRRIYEAWAKYGKMNEGTKKAAAMFGINGDIQADAKRALFNMRLPGIIDEAKAAIARGEQVVISVVSVSEVDGETGSLVSAISKINTKKVEKVGKDSFSDPTDIPEAWAEVTEIQEELIELGTMPSPIDVLRDAFGDKIEFVTGATSTKDRIQAQRDFQANKLDALVISGAGKTGINLHDVTGKRRMHLIVGDYEWSATNFKQELGRVDRTGQRSSPIVTVMHTGSAGEKKFVATISNRMKGLGATSKGGAESTGTGAMTDTFELGNTIDKIALAAAWQEFPIEWKSAFLDKYFRDQNVPDQPKSLLETNSEALSKFLLGLQSIDLDTANAIVEKYMAKRAELSSMETSADDAASRKTAASTGEIVRQVELGENLRLTEVKASDGSKYGILDGVLTPHMNNVKGIVTAGADYADRFMNGGNAWMRWVQFYDATKGEYVTGLQIKPTRVKDVAEHFGKMLGSGHKPETALVDLRAGDRIAIIGANVAEWELYIGRGGAREGKIVIDGAKMKDRDALMNNGALYSAIGNYFFVNEDSLQQFLKRFPIRTEAIDNNKPLYQKAPRKDGPILPDADPRMPLGGYEEAAAWMPQSRAMDELWAQEINPLLDGMQAVAKKRLNEPMLDGAYRDMSPEAQKQLQQYLKGVQVDMASTKMAATRWGQAKRDQSLLNYNRRTGLDQMLDVVFPYQFFYTRSMMTWAKRALDNPAILANYARLRRQQDRYENNLPERLRGKVRIEAPWMPDWMGDALYIDPLSVIFTPHNFMRPFEQMMKDSNMQTVEAERILQEWAQEERMPMDAIQQAAQTRSGKVWEQALAEAELRRESQISNPMDFVSATFGPAWYLSTPAKMLGIGGEKRETISELPITRTARAFETVTQNTFMEPVGDLIGLLAKPEQAFRKKYNLPEMGEYGDYYIDRQLSNMVAERLISSEDAIIAMIERDGPLFEQARERTKLELAMRVPLMGATYAALNEGPLAGLQALPASLFGAGLLPEGELEYRGQKQEWNDAWKLKDAGDEDAINRFFDENPEYESYLAKGKEPEERLRSFLIGQIWDGYMGLGETNRKQARAEMGDLFANAFLNKETRSYDTLDVETLTQWAQMLNERVPQTEQTMPAIEAPRQINYYAPEVTAITDTYFEQRKRLYPNYFEQERKYYALPKSERATFLLANPTLKQYWNWKDGWYTRHPELVPVFNGQVFKRVDTSTWSPLLVQSVQMYALLGQPLGTGAYKALEQQWIQAGRPRESMQDWLQIDIAPAMMYGP